METENKVLEETFENLSLDQLNITVQEQGVRIRELEIIEQEMEYLEVEYGKVKTELESLYKLVKVLSWVDIILAVIFIYHMISMMFF